MHACTEIAGFKISFENVKAYERLLKALDYSFRQIFKRKKLQLLLSI